jgi:tetratricopeptide (TPR) repeat protein
MQFAIARTNTDILLGIVTTFALVACVVWFLWRTLKRTEDPPRLVFKWILTVIVMGLLLHYVLPAVAQGGFGAIAGVLMAAVLGLVLAIIWRYNIAMMVAKPFASLYDGGNDEADPKPFYSVARAKRMRGDYLGARNAVRAELLRFPTDVEGQMLLAEIEAQDLHDLQAADIVVQRFIQQKDHAPANLAYALNSMADWHLKFAQDREAARTCLERIGELLPESEWALRAAQRMAHLGGTDLLLGTEARRTFKVTHIEGDPGLDATPNITRPVEEDGGDLAAGWVKHLEEFPHDTEIREKLARLYAEHFHRLDLAEDQLEQLIQYPNQPAKQVIRWLNLLADLQVSHGATYDAARATLQRVIDQYPDAGAAQMAQNRIELLRLEFKGKEKSQTVKPGSYEDDLGLKGNLPHQL